MVSEIKEMLNATNNESAMSQGSTNLKVVEKMQKLKDRPDAPITVLTKPAINIGATMILDDPHLTVRQLASLLDISIGHFPLGGVAYNSPEFLSHWYLIIFTDRMKFP